MRLGFAMRALNGVLRFLERRPWCIAGVYLLMELLKYLALAILFTNHCPSTLRFVPELSDEFAAWVSDIYDFSLKAAAVVGAVMLVAPVIPMVFRRYRTVVVMLVLGIDDIRDVIAFPKVQNASELMSKCPTYADPKALEELGIAIVGSVEE